MNRDIEVLAHKFDRLQRDNACLQARLEHAEARYHRAERRFRAQALLAMAVLVVAILVSPASRSAFAQAGKSMAARVAGLEAEVADLQTRTQYVSVENGEMYITGTNLHIVNGLGATNGNPGKPFSVNPADTAVNGKGNLIIGYNETPGADHHTGSHNLVVGSEQTYSSFGGLVAGEFNTVLAPYGSVSGGSLNFAVEPASSVSGGYSNTANGPDSSVGGGAGNIANDRYSTVSGGDACVATGNATTVSGGFMVKLSVDGGWAGGFYHTP